MTTKEKYSTTATVTVNVLDGDDQYPQFQPCAPVYEDGDHNICTNPVYSVNITETDEVCVLCVYRLELFQIPLENRTELSLIFMLFMM